MILDRSYSFFLLNCFYKRRVQKRAQGIVLASIMVMEAGICSSTDDFQCTMSEHVLTQVTLILFLGIGSQWLAWRLKLPSILMLLVAGFVAGPVMGHQWVDPDALFGDLLMPLVSVSVGLILFEGGLTLKFRELDDVGPVVIKLVTIGAAVTWGLSIVLARLCLGWDWALCALLGAISGCHRAHRHHALVTLLAAQSTSFLCLEMGRHHD
jgi:Kef-type K+ transport system membrane component KefB